MPPSILGWLHKGQKSDKNTSLYRNDILSIYNFGVKQYLDDKQKEKK